MSSDELFVAVDDALDLANKAAPMEPLRVCVFRDPPVGRGGYVSADSPPTVGGQSSLFADCRRNNPPMLGLGLVTFALRALRVALAPGPKARSAKKLPAMEAASCAIALPRASRLFWGCQKRVSLESASVGVLRNVYE